jgi:glyoxylase-like metal-dependent hydrolase (beta-lactamase superfamily II)
MVNRRDFLASTAAAAAAGALARPSLLAAWQAQAQQAAPLFAPIRRNVGFFTMRGGTIGYLINDGGIAVVDSQFPAEATACLNGIKERANGRTLDVLINTHHHGDHSGGNISFKGATKKVVAHAKANEHMRNVPGAPPPAAGATPPEQLYPDTTFTDRWSADIGDEKVTATWRGRAHTSGDATIAFERANIVHMGDLLFKQRHPVVDRAAGATLKGWITVLERTSRDYAADTIYIAGHANTGLPVTGGREDLAAFRDYLGAVLAHVEAQHKGGKTKEEILANREPLKGFEGYGQFNATGAREIRTCAYDEITTGA